MDINSVFPSKYLKASDLHSQRPVVQIGKVQLEDVAGGGDPETFKPVLYFENKKAGLVLNKTNANSIAAIYGPETDNWIGRHIELFSSQTDFQGRRVPCIRVEVPEQEQSEPAAAGNTVDGDNVPF